MTITASQKYVRCSPQKLKFVADSVKHLNLVAMREQLKYMNKEAARRLLQTLNQALANASHNYGLSPDQLTLESLLILRGPEFKRMRAVSRGQGHSILKRTAHIVIKLKSEEKVAPTVEAKAEDEAEEVKAVAAEVKETPKTEIKKTVKKAAPKKAATKKENK